MFRTPPELSNAGRAPLTRRDALKSAALGAGGLALAAIGPPLHAREEEKIGKDDASGAPDSGDNGAGYIDAHVHVWTPDTKSYPLAEGYAVADMQPPSFTPQELFDHCRPCGVSRIVLIQMSFYGFDNSYMLDAIREHPGVFSGVAVIDEEARRPQDEMLRLKSLGVRGFRIRPGGRPVATWLDGPGMDAMWRAGADEGLSMCHLIDADSLPAIDRMCRKHPDTPVVIDHFARIGVDGTIRDSDVQALCDLARHKHVAVKVSAFYALGKKASPYLDLAPMARRLLDAYGPQRLMWATDCPYQVDPGHNYQDSVDLIRERIDFLDDNDRAWLLRKTAERVFFS
jgi:predicted TIM-barrel fold metal-dependent hydrolase